MCYSKTITEVNEKLKSGFELVVVVLFHETQISLNPGRCHCMGLGSKIEKAVFSFGGKIFKNSKEKSCCRQTSEKRLPKKSRLDQEFFHT